MWPIIAIAAVSAAAQAYQAEKARGASASRLKQLEHEFDALVPPEYDMSPMDPPAYLETKLKSPEFSGDLTPAMASYIEEEAPTLVNRTADGETGRSAQREALRRFQAIGSTSGIDPGLAASLSEADVAAKRTAQGRAGAVRDRYRRRGALDGGMAMLSEIQENASANQTQAMAGQRAAADAYRNRLDAIRESARLGAGMEDSDVSLQSKNAGIINEFNNRNARSRQGFENNRAGVINDASNRNQTRRDALSKYEYDRQRGERSDFNSMADSKAKWAKGERDRGDDLTNRMYQDKVQKAGARQGLVFARNELDMGAARDRNSAIQGMTNAGIGAYQSSADRDMKREGWDREDARAGMGLTSNQGKWRGDEMADEADQYDKYGRTV